MYWIIVSQNTNFYSSFQNHHQKGINLFKWSTLREKNIYKTTVSQQFMVRLFSFFFLKTENFLKHKIRSRPDRSELVRMHILEGEGFTSTYFAAFSQEKK